ncbi:telomeric repeat-binding factor 2-interacting protein 1-like [Carassius carassius]|uniref:telomeric repeat-binding factor 2-interacting protein 1-like n=1 Tax=Carassius carassius TaxID=217509 RepID=UPI002868C3D8|nr:telomeric repeat-binding factor 2-interacting protein 1-like [Carassius carassius]
MAAPVELDESERVSEGTVKYHLGRKQVNLSLAKDSHIYKRPLLCCQCASLHDLEHVKQVSPQGEPLGLKPELQGIHVQQAKSNHSLLGAHQGGKDPTELRWRRTELNSVASYYIVQDPLGHLEVPYLSPVLFLDTSGQSMCFYVRPGPTKTQLYPLITNGGGSLCRSQEPGAILLIDPGDATTVTASSGLQYISTKYITDCVEQNLQLDLDDYVISVGPSVQTRMASRHQGSGRLGYSPEDDAAIVKFMEKRQHEAKGNLVWKEMEKRRVTEHSWQSMRDRFLKHLQNRLPKKSPTKRKPLCFTQSPLRKKKVTENSEPETDASQNSPQKSVVDESDTQVASENSVCPVVRTDPQPSPERARAPPDVTDAAGEPPQDERDVPVREQETPEPEASRRSGLDEDRDGRDLPDGPSEQSSPNKTRQTTKASTADSRQLGILAKAAREFEDSDVVRLNNVNLD